MLLKQYLLVNYYRRNNLYLYKKLDKNNPQKLLDEIYNYMKTINNLSFDFESDINEANKPQE